MSSFEEFYVSNFVNIRSKKRNVFTCKFPRHWLIVLVLSTIIFLIIVNFVIPYNSVYKDLSSNTKLAYVSKEDEGQWNGQKKTHPLKETDKNPLHDKCETIHIGFVCSGYRSNLYLHTLLKSLFFYNINPIHFHIMVNKVSEKVLKTLFDTWNVPQSNTTFYDINDYIQDVRWVPNSHYSGIFGLLKLVFPKIIPLNVTKKIIVLDTDLTFVGDIIELWRLFEKFNNKQAVGIVENQSDYYLGKNTKIKPWPASGRGFNSGVLLYNLERLRRLDWPSLWPSVAKKVAIIYGSTRLGDQDIINAVLLQHTDLLYQVPCFWNTQLSDHALSYNCYNKFRVKVVHWNSPKKTHVLNKDGDYFRTLYQTFVEYNGNLLRRQLYYCDATQDAVNEPQTDLCAEFHRAKTSQWRTLLFFREYQHSAEENAKNDVTFVAQLSYDRLQMVEELVKYWQGPISLTFYVTDPEFQQCYNFIENSELLQDRTNIAYHAVFKDGEYHPINILRNVGLKNVATPFVFLADIDFLPMKGLYSVLKSHLNSIHDMKAKALIVPAFETQRYRSRVPKNKAQLLGMWEKKSIFPFRSDVWVAGHAPTNYTKWKSAIAPYKVKWEPDFEPYIVVSSDVTEYDNRFMGFGWNKVSHIMELEAQGYQWIVLPNAFIIHKPHAPSYDIAKFRTSPVYRMCLQNLKEEFIKDLDKKYGRLFDNKNTSFLLDIK
nr:PREDICTED: glycosyltransferase-like protein LARGE2 [Tribolium castaneum]|eukprot:XP_008192494.1 PREDICTED: glycosyltransferase-like protein LARGE2 [Tribolium castaneum]